MSEGLIVVDWGSSNLRFYLLSAKGEILADKKSNKGISVIGAAEIIDTLLQNISEWPSLPILCIGMIGSKNGLVETPYLTCPIHPKQLSKALLDVSSLLQREAYIVPGLSCEHSGFIDVIRGEESIAAGVSPSAIPTQVCMPGTHSKWLRLDNGKIESFQTFPTGELFACIPNSPIFQYSFSEASEHCDDSFLLGIEQSQKGSSLTHQLFSLRSNYIFMKSWKAHSFLSGLLIGHEVSHACKTNTVLLIANDRLGELYQKTFEQLLPDVNITCQNEQETLLNGALTLWRQR